VWVKAAPKRRRVSIQSMCTCTNVAFTHLLFSSLGFVLFTAAGAGALASFFLSFLPVWRGETHTFGRREVRSVCCSRDPQGGGTDILNVGNQILLLPTQLCASTNNQRAHLPLLADFAGPGTGSPVRSCGSGAGRGRKEARQCHEHTHTPHSTPRWHATLSHVSE
jgi:hypothetical protein